MHSATRSPKPPAERRSVLCRPGRRRAGSAAGVAPSIALGALLLAAGVLAAALLAGDTREEAVTTAPKTVKGDGHSARRTTVVKTGDDRAQRRRRPRRRRLAPVRQPIGSEQPGLRADEGRQLRGRAATARTGSRRGCQASGSLARGIRELLTSRSRGFALGRCDAVAELLDRSEQIQGKRKEISKATPRGEERLRGGALGGCEPCCVLLLVVRLVLAGLDRLPPAAVLASTSRPSPRALSSKRLQRRPAEPAQLRVVSSE